MRYRIPLVAALLAATPALAQLNLPRPSPKASVMQVVGTTEVTITYSRPAVKGRVIWGDLVPYDKVWRAGANESTTFQISSDVEIEGRKLPAGIYSLQMIPGKAEWTVIFNRNAKLWGAYDYRIEDDVLRVKVRAQSAEMHERLTFAITPISSEAATVTIGWEKLRVSFTVKTDANAKAVAAIQEAVGKVKPDDWRTPYDAAVWAWDNKYALSDAAGWADQSVKVQGNFWNFRMKALLAAELGKTADAKSAGEKALASVATMPRKPPADVIDEFRKTVAGWK
ncbi:MAG: DUF2911 domain-containing protein [Thermoanaerobaculia bacterium]